MRILFLSTRFPYPPTKGDQVVVYNRLKTLGTKHDITLLTFTEEEIDPAHEEALRPYCSRIVKVPHTRLRAALNILSRGPYSKLPLQVLYYESINFRNKLQDLLKEDFQIVHLFLLRLFPYTKIIDRPIIMECIDSMRLNVSRQVDISSIPMRWAYKEELRRLNHYESTIDTTASHTIFVSPIDVAASGSKKALVFPNGVEIPEISSEKIHPIIAFSGNMRYPPNIQAVNWFVKNCWSSIHKAVPDATFRILGAGAPASICALGSVPGVEVVGYVKDMMSELLKAAVAVAPMQSGSGIQNKVLEAMACALPVVTTTIGLGSIEALRSEEILVCDSPDAFSRDVVKLLQSHELRSNIGENAKKFVSVHHSWNFAGEHISALYDKLNNCKQQQKRFI